MTEKEIKEKLEIAYNALDSLKDFFQEEKKRKLNFYLSDVERRNLFGNPGWGSLTGSARLTPTKQSEVWESNHMENVWLPTLNRKLYVNKTIKQPLLDALSEISTYTTYQIHSIGCFNPRRIGYQVMTAWSYHAFGAAVDINPDKNPRGKRGDMPDEVVKIFEKHGFYWGGNFNNRDDMHFEYHGFEE